MQTSPEIIDKQIIQSYMVEALSAGNLADLSILHTAVYGKSAGIPDFVKKYNTAYTSVCYVGFIAYNEDRLPVAYYGVIPCFIEQGNTIILAAQSADTMTHPEHRFKGMFVDLSNRTFERCRELGILLIFGFPNQNSYHGAVNKLGWKMTGSMTCFTIRVKTIPLAAIAKKNNWLAGMYDRYIQLVGHKRKSSLAGVANSVIKDGFAGIARNEEYFQYKKYSATKVIKIERVKFWFSHKYSELIGDIEGLTKENFLPVMDQLKRVARQRGISALQFHCSPGSFLHELFSEQFDASPSYPMLFQDFGSAIDPQEIKFTFADIDIF